MSIAIITTLLSMAVAISSPSTPRHDVIDTYHGVTIVDPYRWLEDSSADEVRRWSDAQNAHARAFLDKLPDVPAIRSRVSEIMLAKTYSYSSLKYVKGKLFAIKRQPPKQQPFLLVMNWPGDPATSKVLVDPNELDSHGGTAIDWYVPSPDGNLMAVSLSKWGSEAGDVHLFDAKTGHDTGEVVPRANGGTAGGDLSWAADSAGFFYSRYPRHGERPDADLDFFTQVYFHKLGTPTQDDRYEIGKEFPRIAEIKLATAKSGHVLVTMQNGDGGEFELHLRSPNGTWTQLSRIPDQIVAGVFVPKDKLFLISRKGAPRGELLRLSLTTPTLSAAQKIIPEGKDAIVSHFGSPDTFAATDTLLYVEYQTGGPSEIRVFDHAGRPQSAPRQLEVSSVGGMAPLDGDELLFSNVSFVEPPAFYHYQPQTGKTEKTALATPSPVEFNDVQVVREFATSKDGTRIPLSIMLPKSAKRDGSNPCLVTGYGGYGISLAPSFRPNSRVLFDQGFISVVANLRGGGEFGEAWHLSGSLTKKQNVFDDFAAVLQHLIARGYTSPEHLAIIGGSNGGLLMGAMLTQHPELVKAVVSSVGIYDMLRVELSPNGAFNVPEFGTVKDADQFRALSAYSPYHHVLAGAKYPAILMLTGANDPRVDPMQSRKMIARLQSANTSAAPILLRTSANTGHGMGTPLTEQIDEQVDIYAFLFDQLGIKFRRGE
ncbi:MAG TPA: alpha/beta fold hydrolase [Pirellulales bacterium]|jgi:prolyl oligopeptidase|nr:alpha/beta fold hydrolase [Pirellulales bacterium]